MHFRTLRHTNTEVSLSEPIDTDSEGNALELMDILGSEEDMFEDLLRSDRASALRQAVTTVLDPREREIIRLRYGLGGNPPLTQRETAARLSISRSYISRIEKGAIGRLREAMRGRMEETP